MSFHVHATGQSAEGLFEQVVDLVEQVNYDAVSEVFSEAALLFFEQENTLQELVSHYQHLGYKPVSKTRTLLILTTDGTDNTDKTQ